MTHPPPLWRVAAWFILAVNAYFITGLTYGAISGATATFIPGGARQPPPPFMFIIIASIVLYLLLSTFAAWPLAKRSWSPPSQPRRVLAWLLIALNVLFLLAACAVLVVAEPAGLSLLTTIQLASCLGSIAYLILTTALAARVIATARESRSVPASSQPPI